MFATSKDAYDVLKALTVACNCLAACPRTEIDMAESERCYTASSRPYASMLRVAGWLDGLKLDTCARADYFSHTVAALFHSFVTTDPELYIHMWWPGSAPF